MARGPNNQLPVMGLHRSTGQARVIIRGKEHYLGPWGSDRAQEKYDALIATHLSRGRAPVEESAPVTVEELGDLHVEWAKDYYLKGDKPTSTAANIELTLVLLYRAGHAQMSIDSFRPFHLRAFQRWMALEPSGRWSRTTINKRITHVVEMFQWGVERGFVGESVWRALTAVRHLRKGRRIEGTTVVLREPKPVRPADRGRVEATLPHLQPTVAAMVRLQLVTAMRPDALCAMRKRDIHPTDSTKVLVYVVPAEAYKLEHMEGESGEEGRRVYLGPKAREILDPLLATIGADDYVFSPARSEAAHNAERRARRRTKVYGRQSAEERRARRAKWSSRRVPGDRYITTAYRRAIERACRRAFPAPEGINPSEVKAWHHAHHWNPNQLRHSAATSIADREDIEAAKLLLGHRSSKTTERYARTREKKAIAAAKRRG